MFKIDYLHIKYVQGFWQCSNMVMVIIDLCLLCIYAETNEKLFSRTFDKLVSKITLYGAVLTFCRIGM